MFLGEQKQPWMVAFLKILKRYLISTLSILAFLGQFSLILADFEPF
jgi:hypothetical protein